MKMRALLGICRQKLGRVLLYALAGEWREKGLKVPSLCLSLVLEALKHSPPLLWTQTLGFHFDA